jgi:hypothetical protein
VPPEAIRWGIFGCASALALPLIMSGIGFITAAIYTNDKAFGFVGALMVAVATAALIAAWTTGKRMARVVEIRRQHPNEPWKWRDDWASGVIRENTSGTTGLWIFSIFWIAVCSPVLFFMGGEVRRGNLLRGNVPLLIAILFPLVGLALMGVAAYMTLRQRKYGRSVCRLSRMPAEPGQAIRGEIQARLAELPAEGFKLRLASIRRITTSSGKSSTTREETLWSEERIVAAAAVGRSPEGMRLPFSFNVPATAEPTDIRNTRDQVVWRLEVEADVPGIDYDAKFELPVFARDGQ